MAHLRERRQFLLSVCQGTLLATVGPTLAVDIGLTSKAFADSATEPTPLRFGELETLVCLLQETSIDKLQPVLVRKIQDGLSLKTLTAAAALANARTFGGEDYIGFHTFMALSPALRMASMMPTGQEALPILKVLFRNTNRIQEFGGRNSETLHELTDTVSDSKGPAELQKAIRSRELNKAEQVLASLAASNPHAAFEALLPCVQDNPEVHRTVLPFRAWEMQQLVGTEHAVTLLRQSLHYCVQMEAHRKSSWQEHGELLIQLIDEFGLDKKPLGKRPMEDQEFLALSQTFATASASDAARAAAQALAEGFEPSAVGEAISLAASHLVLIDGGRPPQWEDRLKPPGSVHGDSAGVHASDSANAWRNMASVCEGPGKIACLVIGAWQIARDRIAAGYLLKEELPSPHHVRQLSSLTSDELLSQLDSAVRDNLQGRASAIAYRYGQENYEPQKIFSTLLKYAVSEDGALHAEKYFHTVWDDFHSTRDSTRWQHIAALARVTASEFGKPAAGQMEARELLGVG